MLEVHGRCHCNAVTFTALVDPNRVIACHCADCQQFSGGPFRAVLPTPVGQVQLTGPVKQYVKVAASGNRRAQVFCPECGTQLYATEPDAPTMLGLRVGCIDERAQLKPAVQIWVSSAMPWVAHLSAVPAHAQGPSSPRTTL
jgi:hypothetical protein